MPPRFCCRRCGVRPGRRCAASRKLLAPPAAQPRFARRVAGGLARRAASSAPGRASLRPPPSAQRLFVSFGWAPRRARRPGFCFRYAPPEATLRFAPSSLSLPSAPRSVAVRLLRGAFARAVCAQDGNRLTPSQASSRAAKRAEGSRLRSGAYRSFSASGRFVSLDTHGIGPRGAAWRGLGSCPGEAHGKQHRAPRPYGSGYYGCHHQLTAVRTTTHDHCVRNSRLPGPELTANCGVHAGSPLPYYRDVLS